MVTDPIFFMSRDGDHAHASATSCKWFKGLRVKGCTSLA